MDTPKPPPPTTTNAAASTSASDHRLENLKSLLMKCAIASTPAKSLTPPQKTFIEERIQQFFPICQTPDHPPYAWMIENAIKLLSEEGGSTEEAISKFILGEYKDLPWAHAALLKHHLRKLSDNGNLLEIHDGCYLIGKPSTVRKRTSKLCPSFSFKATPILSSSPSYSPSPSLSPSPSSSPSYSSSSTYASTSTSSSSQSYNPRKRRKSKKRSRQLKQNARGIKIHPKCKGIRGRGRYRGRGRGRGRGCGRGQDQSYSEPWKEKMMEEAYVDQVEDEVCMHDENIEGKEQNFESQAEQRSMVIEVDSPEQEFRANEERIGLQQQEKEVSGDDCSILSTIPLSHKQKLITKQGHEQGSRKGRLQKRSIHPKHTPKPPREISGQCKKNLQMEETGKNVEILEEAEVGALRGKDKRTTEEESSLIKVCLINDDNMVPEWLTYDFPLAVNTNMREGGIEEYVGEMEPHKEDMLDELIEEVYMELTEAPDIQSLTTEDEEAEGNLQREEHYQVQGNQDSVNVECQAEPNDMVIEIDPQEQEYEDNDDLNEQQLQESESAIPDEAEMNVEPKNVEFDESCWIKGQNHTQIHVQEDIGGMEGQIQVNEDKDEGVEGQKFATGIEDEINKRSLMDRSGEVSNCDPKEREYNIVEENECRGNPIVEVMIEQQLHPLPLPTILALELDEPRKEVSHWNEQQDQPTKGQTEIVGQEKMSEGVCPFIEEENNLKNGLEVLEEQNQKIEVIIEQNQREDQHCNFVDRDKKENEEFEHCDDMRKSEKGNSDEPNPSEKAQAGTLEQKEHHHKETNEDQNQHLEQIKSLFSEQEVEIAEHVPPIKESKEVSTEIVNLGDNAEYDQNTILTSERSSVSMMQNEQIISENMEQQSKCTDQQSDNSGVEMTSEVKSMEDSSTSQSHQKLKRKMEKPRCRQLRPRPTKSQPDQIEESSLDNSSETDQRRKLRPRRSKDESSKAANSDEPLASRLRKRKEVGARRSLRH